MIRRDKDTTANVQVMDVPQKLARVMSVVVQSCSFTAKFLCGSVCLCVFNHLWTITEVDSIEEQTSLVSEGDVWKTK